MSEDLLTIEVEFFGGLRSCVDKNPLSIQVAQGATLGELRKAISHLLAAAGPRFNNELFAASAFATKTTILKDSELVDVHRSIAVLPPVCGG